MLGPLEIGGKIMAFRFHKRKKILPGVSMNLSKSGVGFRVGGKNAGVSISTKGTRASASVPRTGLSMSKKVSDARTPTWGGAVRKKVDYPAPRLHPDFRRRRRPFKLWYWIAWVIVLFITGAFWLQLGSLALP
jgi:hypothetical protein